MKKKLTLFGLSTIFSLTMNAQCNESISEEKFQTELSIVKSHDFDEAKKEAIANILNSCLSSIQLKTLLSELSFEEDKLELAKKAFTNISDPNNFGVIKEIFDFDDSKKEIETLMK